jgi:hypothetical protein
MARGEMARGETARGVTARDVTAGDVTAWGLMARAGRALSTRVRCGAERERGMVTAELATALPVLVLVTFAATAAVSVGQDQIRCADAAREAARAIARGDSAPAPTLAAAAAGGPVRVLTSAGADITTVQVSRRFQPLSWLPAFTVSESASVDTEGGDGS